MWTFSHRKPYLTALIAIGTMSVFEFAILTQTVFAQGAAVETSYDPLKIISLVVLAFNFIGFAAAFVWYIVRGKSTDQLTKNNQDLAMSNSELRAKVAELKAEVTEVRGKLESEEAENERLRKANLRLQGVNDR